MQPSQFQLRNSSDGNSLLHQRKPHLCLILLASQACIEHDGDGRRVTRSQKLAHHLPRCIRLARHFQHTSTHLHDAVIPRHQLHRPRACLQCRFDDSIIQKPGAHRCMSKSELRIELCRTLKTLHGWNSVPELVLANAELPVIARVGRITLHRRGVAQPRLGIFALRGQRIPRHRLMRSRINPAHDCRRRR